MMFDVFFKHIAYVEIPLLQNVGGLGLEVRSHKRRGVTGPKLQYISQCVNINKTELLVLTETRAKTIEESRNTYVKKSRMKVIMATSSGRTVVVGQRQGSQF